MRSLTVVAVVALTIAGATVAVAQQQTPAPAEPQPFERWQPSAEDVNALTDARIAGLKAGLRLTHRAGAALASNRACDPRRGTRALRPLRRPPFRAAGEGSDRAAAPACGCNERAGRYAQTPRGCGRAALSEPRRGAEAPVRDARSHGWGAPGGPWLLASARGRAPAALRLALARAAPNAVAVSDAGGVAPRCWTALGGFDKRRRSRRLPHLEGLGA
jgi:hypothetical protein